MTMRYSAESTMIDLITNGLKSTVLNCVCNKEGVLCKYLCFMFNNKLKLIKSDKKKNTKSVKHKQKP